MNKLIKIFPFLPAEKDGGKLALALVFYLIAPTVAASIICPILGATVILLPLAFIVGPALAVYSIMGVIFSIMSFTGHDFTAVPENKPAEETTEETPEE